MTILNVVISFFNIKNLFDFTQEFTRFVQSRGVHLSGILEPVQRGLATHATACPKCLIFPPLVVTQNHGENVRLCSVRLRIAV
jgi:hypothetical protein